MIQHTTKDARPKRIPGIAAPARPAKIRSDISAATIIIKNGATESTNVKSIDLIS